MIFSRSFRWNFSNFIFIIHIMIFQKKTLSMNKNICNQKKLLKIFILDIVFVNDFGESD